MSKRRNHATRAWGRSKHRKARVQRFTAKHPKKLPKVSRATLLRTAAELSEEGATNATVREG